MDLDKYGPKVFSDLKSIDDSSPITLDDFALIDEMSGLNHFLDNFMASRQVPETVKDRVKARMVKYSGVKSKDIALNELRDKIFGNQR